MSRRKFAISTVTSVRCEQKLIELADAMDITLSDALTKGILLTAEFKLEHDPGKYSSEIYDTFLALQKKDLDELSEWLGIQKLHQKRISEFVEAKRKSEEPPKKILVYASDVEETILIDEDKFDPRWHSRRTATSS